MSETPEVDAEAMDGTDCYGDSLKSWDYKASKDGEVVPSEFARRLERERDAAREELASVRKQLVAAKRGAETNATVTRGLFIRLDDAKRERDDALKEWDLAREGWDKALDERDEARLIAKMAYTRLIGLGVSSHTQIQFMHDAINKWGKEQKEKA